MARLPAAPPAAQNLATRACLWLVRRMFGRQPRPYGIFAHAPEEFNISLVVSAAIGREKDIERQLNLRLPALDKSGASSLRRIPENARAIHHCRPDRNAGSIRKVPLPRCVNSTGARKK